MIVAGKQKKVKKDKPKGPGRYKNFAVEPCAHPLDDVVVEGFIRLQLVPDRAELGLLFVRILRAGLLAVRGGFLAEATGGDDLGQPDTVALGLVRGISLLATFLARVPGEDVEAADGLFGDASGDEESAWGKVVSFPFEFTVSEPDAVSMG
jgi:hypothetical protein